eukprot:scaffold656_cov403-Pavlova_lutheri.AAC.9
MAVSTGGAHLWREGESKEGAIVLCPLDHVDQLSDRSHREMKSVPIRASTHQFGSLFASNTSTTTFYGVSQNAGVPRLDATLTSETVDANGLE